MINKQLASIGALFTGALLWLLLGAAAPMPLLRNPFTTNVYPAAIIGGQNFATNVLIAGNITNSMLSPNLGVMTGSGSQLISVAVSNLIWASTVDINFNTSAYQYLIMTNNTTFTGSQLGAGKAVAVKIFAGTTNYTLTFPAWTFLGAAAPTLLASNKTAVLSLTAFDGNITNVVAAWAAQP